MKEALAYPSWFQAMKEELDALEANDTWDLVLKMSDAHYWYQMGCQCQI